MNNKLEIKPVKIEELNKKTRRLLAKILRDAKQGKGLSPAFDSVEEAIKYLKS